MERELTQEQVIEHWTLAPGEHLLLMNKGGSGRLGFAVLLKFLQAEGIFLTARTEVPAEAVDYLVQQINTSPKNWYQYDWQGRTIKYHRAEIRTLLSAFCHLRTGEFLLPLETF